MSMIDLCMEINAKKVTWMFMSCDDNVIKITNKYFQNVTMFTHFGRSVTNRNERIN